MAATGLAFDAAGSGNTAPGDEAGGIALDVADAGGDAPDCAGTGCFGAFGTVLESVVITGCSQSPVML